MLLSKKSEAPLFRKKLTKLLNELPDSQVQEVYHFTIFLKERFAKSEVSEDSPSVHAGHPASLLGLVALGGDALKDTEDIYNE